MHTFLSWPTAGRAARRLTAALALLAALFVGAPDARAQSCSGTGCNGLNPLAAGCTGSQTILASRDLTDENSLILGYLYLIYSNDCSTVYTEVWPSWETSDVYTEVTTNGLGYNDSGTGAQMSPMIFDTTPSGAHGYGSVSVYTCTIFGCQNYYAGGDLTAP